MKNKIRVIDVNILSTYLGRWMTLLSILVVVSLTLSALYGNRRGQHNIIRVCVVADLPEQAFEPFRVLLGRETRRTVVVSPPGHDHDGIDRCDVFVMRTADFFRDQARLDLEALFEIQDSDRPNDQAVVFARSDDSVRLSQVASNEVAFSSPSSINGYWVQASVLAGLGGGAEPDRYQFVGGGPDATRVIFAVLYGEYRLGACRLSTITEMRRRGILQTGELAVLEKADALPETIVAVARGDAAYYRREVGDVGARLLPTANAGGTPDETVQLLRSFGIKGLVPANAERLEQARRLARVYGGIEPSAAP